MNINNPKNELYQDFVQLVDHVSTAIVKESIVPISGQMTTASKAMQQSSDHIQEMNKSISNITQDISGIQNKIQGISLIISDKIDKELKANIEQKHHLIEKKFSELNQNNQQLQTRINELQARQDLFFYISIGLVTFFSIIMIYLILSIYKGMQII